MVRIPMIGRCDSINVSVATGVLLFEMFDQRRGVRSATTRHDINNSRLT